MIESVINIIFSGTYLLTGVFFAVIFDLFIYKTKATSRLSLMEIWGCTMCWPLVLLFVVVTYLINNDN